MHFELSEKKVKKIATRFRRNCQFKIGGAFLTHQSKTAAKKVFAKENAK